jgi:hypothetical protein
MITRADLLVLGLYSSVLGGLAGGILLFTGMNMVMSGQNLGWLFMLVAGPVCGGIGFFLARRAAKRGGLGSKPKSK